MGRHWSGALTVKETDLKPLWPFYGSKWRDAKRYGKPCGDLVIEPFAGSAGYSTFWAPKRVMLFDVDPYVVGVWRYLLSVSQPPLARETRKQRAVR